MQVGDYRIFQATKLMNPIFHGKCKVQICCEGKYYDGLVWKNLDANGNFCDNTDAYIYNCPTSAEIAIEKLKQSNAK
jgi:hypothetical protein